MRSFLKFGVSVLSVLLVLSASTGCGKKKKKDWQCTCVVSDTGNVMLGNASKFIERYTKSQADTACSDYGSSIYMPFSKTHSESTYNCTVK